MNLNFLNKKKLHDLFGNVYALVGINVEVDDFSCFVILINKYKDEILIKDRLIISNINEFELKIKKEIPLIINFYGKKILNKKIENEQSYIDEILLKSGVDKFYTYKLKQGENDFISICRKDVLNFYIDKFKDYNLLDYSIGPFVGILAKSFLNEEEIIIHNYKFKFDDNLLIEIEEITSGIKKEYNLENESLNSKEVPLISTFLNYINSSPNIDYENIFLGDDRTNYKYQKALKKLLISGIIFLLISLISSFVLLGKFNLKIKNYELSLYKFKDNFVLVQGLKKEVNNKEAIITNNLIKNASSLSFYVYEIANSVEEGIRFESLSLNPAKSKIKAKSSILFDTNVLIIKGETSSKKAFNKWIKKIKKYKWVKKTELLDFHKDNIESAFVIKLNLI